MAQHKAIISYGYYGVHDITEGNVIRSSRGYILMVIKPTSIDIHTPKGVRTVRPASDTVEYARRIVKNSEAVVDYNLNMYTREMGEYNLCKAVTNNVKDRVLKRYGFAKDDFIVIPCI